MAQTIEELEKLRLSLLDDIFKIEAQLSETRKYDPDGRMWSEAEYHAWRTRAVHAKAGKTNHLARLNLAIKSMNREQAERARKAKAERLQAAAHGVDPADTAGLILSARTLLKRLAVEGVEYDPPEQAIIDGLGAWLCRNSDQKGEG